MPTDGEKYLRWRREQAATGWLPHWLNVTMTRVKSVASFVRDTAAFGLLIPAFYFVFDADRTGRQAAERRTAEIERSTREIEIRDLELNTWARVVDALEAENLAVANAWASTALETFNRMEGVHLRNQQLTPTFASFATDEAISIMQVWLDDRAQLNLDLSLTRRVILDRVNVQHSNLTVSAGDSLLVRQLNATGGTSNRAATVNLTAVGSTIFDSNFEDTYLVVQSPAEGASGLFTNDDRSVWLMSSDFAGGTVYLSGEGRIVLNRVTFTDVDVFIADPTGVEAACVSLQGETRVFVPIAGITPRLQLFQSDWAETDFSNVQGFSVGNCR